MKFLSSISLILIAAAISTNALPTASDSTPASTLIARGYSASGAETSYCMWPSRWIVCNKAKGHATEALTAAQQNFPANTLHNGKGDAFRHCYWNARMTVDMGQDTAKTFADLHEEGGGGPAAEGEMDLANNASGRKFGEEVKSGGGDDGDKYARALAKCKSAANSGVLKVLG
ncbi:hypothetical protein L873DRAFT_1825894 [Choiromyces venosus 120613-1]|uniref:DUF6973 domain-containing protein n=1 Tax=Choiromyces venosus 120613-1 TaxID=1336337 RepID=A0A3N4JZZ9_9PEZI|nr:hypothetical protein L873DRAFT_1825894 [Choiromyces venosus 120613-1]